MDADNRRLRVPAWFWTPAFGALAILSCASAVMLPPKTAWIGPAASCAASMVWLFVTKRVLQLLAFMGFLGITVYAAQARLYVVPSGGNDGITWGCAMHRFNHGRCREIGTLKGFVGPSSKLAIQYWSISIEYGAAMMGEATFDASQHTIGPHPVEGVIDARINATLGICEWDDGAGWKIAGRCGNQLIATQRVGESQWTKSLHVADTCVGAGSWVIYVEGESLGEYDSRTSVEDLARNNTGTRLAIRVRVDR